MTKHTKQLPDDIPVFPLETPAVRALEFIPSEYQGQQVLLVRDPMGVLEGTAVVSAHPLLLIFLQLANGRTTCAEMAQMVTRATGQLIQPSVFEKMARQLDEALLLQSPRFAEALARKREEFAKLEVRPPVVYRAEGVDRLALIKDLADELRRHARASQGPPAQLDLPPKSVRAIMAPHIDYQRGGPAYAWAYRALKEHGIQARTWIVLGTCHRPLSHRFVATRKDFETPLGTVATDRDLLKEIAAEFSGELFRDEYAHATEHTIELQAIYLRHIFGESACPKIVPILVGSFEEFLFDGQRPSDDEEIAAFCGALRRILERHGDDVGLIAGVDLSHCGPQFGHPQLNDEQREREIETGDRAVLSAIELGDPDRFFDVFRPHQNVQQVCSIAPIYCTLAILQGNATPRVLTYQQANSEDRTCLVSFASVAFLKPEALATTPRILIVPG